MPVDEGIFISDVDQQSQIFFICKFIIDPVTGYIVDA
jgi:hypothetical protein